MTDDATALRTFLIDLLTNLSAEMLSTSGAREQVAQTYEDQAATAHPAVASALRDAAAIIRAGFI